MWLIVAIVVFAALVKHADATELLKIILGSRGG
jgi:hypothetical protein